MTEREQIEARIKEVLATESKAIPLSHELFRPGGLFSQLAKTKEERQALVKTTLFREAQRRLSDLQRQEMDEFKRSLREREDISNGSAFALDMEKVQAD